MLNEVDRTVPRESREGARFVSTTSVWAESAALTSATRSGRCTAVTRRYDAGTLESEHRHSGPRVLGQLGRLWRTGQRRVVGRDEPAQTAGDGELEREDVDCSGELDTPGVGDETFFVALESRS